MLTDAHCHPFDLARVFPQLEEERRRLGVTIAASACDLEEFVHNGDLARNAAADKAAAILPCFAVHPQLPAVKSTDGEQTAKEKMEGLINTLNDLSAGSKIAAIGECGFDLYDAAFKGTEQVQDWLFEEHLKAAVCYDLPLVIHARKAMHKIFANVKKLAKCRAVVFHSWSGTYEEGLSLLRLRVNAYFSFGNIILNGHKRAMRCCALFEAQRLLTETDAPFQPQKGKNFSSWTDIPLIIKSAAALRREAQNNITGEEELESVIEKNFFNVFAPL